MDHLTPDGLPHGPVTVVIVDDHQMVLDGLKAMLAPYRDQVEIVGESSDPREAVRLAGELKPDVVLLDVRLRGASGLDLCAEILRSHPRLQGRVPHRLRRRAVPLPGSPGRRGRASC